MCLRKPHFSISFENYVLIFRIKPFNNKKRQRENNLCLGVTNSLKLAFLNGEI